MNEPNEQKQNLSTDKASSACIVSPQTLKQEWADNNEQIIWVEVWNEFSGEWLPRFELYKYPHDTGNFEAVSILIDNKISSEIIYKIINKLAVQRGVANNFRELRRQAG